MSNLHILDIIEKKRDNKILSKEEIEFFVKGYTKGDIPDYQMAALVMAIYLNGMNSEETTNLTISMANSGEILDLSSLNKVFVDKHSTGGVGDKVSLILLPLVASLGVPVAKMSGRGLGFTGGTIDKLESIPGMKTEYTTEEFLNNVQKIGISIISQSLDLAPADKKIYALRDSISCVENISLIASSIMSKKIASGAQKIVLDVTVGDGAFMKDINQARNLSKTMINIGKLSKREVICVLTNMDEPLGFAVGNNLEAKEAVNFLKGNIMKDLKEVVLTLGAFMLKLDGFGENIEENKKKLNENIENGKGFEKLLQLVKNQGGDISYLENINKFPKAKYEYEILAKKDGYISKLSAKNIGKIACYLGAGREKKDDIIDNSVGIVLNKKVGDLVKKDEVIARIYANDSEKLKEAISKFDEVYEVSKNKIDSNIILDIVTDYN